MSNPPARPKGELFALISMMLFVGVVAGLAWMALAGARASPQPTSIVVATWPPSVEEFDRDGLLPETRERLARIEKERKGLGGHPWTGAYVMGDGLGVNERIVLAPQSGLVYTLHGCMGLYRQNHGAIAEEGSRLKITWEGSDEKRERLPMELVPVTWGQRRYLLTPEEIDVFLRRAADKRALPDLGAGRYLIREEDLGKPAAGKPKLPPGFEHLAPKE